MNKCRSRPILLMALFAFLLPVLCYYSVSCSFGYVLDDWSNRARALQYGGAGDLILHSIVHPTRPVSMLFVSLAMKYLWHTPQAFILIGVAGYGFFLWISMVAIFLMVKRLDIAVVFGVLMSSFPILSSNVCWPTMIISSALCALPLYAATWLSYLLYLKREQSRCLFLSSMCYMLGLLSYEIGAILPAALLVIALFCGNRRVFVRSVVAYALPFLLYMIWRGTNALGHGADWSMPVHMGAGYSLWSLQYNARQIVSWWCGAELRNAYLFGWQGFLAIKQWVLFVVVDLLAVVVVGFVLTKVNEQEPVPLKQRLLLVFFGLTLFIGGYIPAMVTYVNSRVSTVPAVGGIIILASILRGNSSWSRIRLVVILMLFLVGLFACQGTMKQWNISAAIYKDFEAEVAEQSRAGDEKVIIVETERFYNLWMKPMVATHNHTTMARFGNAGFLRGFALESIVDSFYGRPYEANCILDVECGLVMNEEGLHWHTRFNPADTHLLLADDAFSVCITMPKSCTTLE